MQVESPRLRAKVFLHWEAWVGLLAFGLCIYAGDDIGVPYGHDFGFIGTLFGGLIGSFAFKKVIDDVAQRYYREGLFKSET